MTSVLALAALCSATLSTTAPTHNVVNLRCEGRLDPIGIGESTPRLSWIIDTKTRNWRQSAYHLVVASSLAKLEGKPDLWDSGKVSSNENAVPYGGKALQSGHEYFWRVMVWDSRGKSSKWSKPARWQMSLLDEEAWSGAKWIGGRSDTSPSPAPLLRRDFTVSGSVRKATLYGCGVGYAEFSLNGKNVADGAEREPGYTDFDKRVLSVAYDVTKQVRTGKNSVGCILGTGWYDVHDLATWRFEKAPWRGRPRARMLLVVETTDGKKQTIVSGDGWRTADGPIRFDGIYTGEVYDARLEQKGWNSPGFDDSGWAVARAMPAPKGRIVARACPPVVITESFKPKAITEPKPGIFVVDFGQNLAGHVRLKLKEMSGTKVVLRYSEHVDKEGMIERSQIEQFMTKANPPQPFQTDTYICKGEGVETWEQRFSYSGFRYVEVTGLPGKPTLDNLTARFAHTNFESAGSFECSNDLLNKIQRATRYAYLSNAQSIPTDCPQREKNGWTGDAHLACEVGLMTFRSEGFYTKWLDDLADSQDKEGRMALIVPTGGWGRGAYHPAWDSAYPIIARDLFLYRGDLREMAKHFERIKAYVDALANQTKEGVVEFDSLGDWVPWSTQTPSQLTSTAFLYLDATIVADAAKLLGKSDDVNKYTALAEKTKAAFLKRFYDPETGHCANGSQTAQSTALYFGLIPEDQRAKVFGVLVSDIERQGHIDTGIIGAKNVLRVLSEGGRSDLAYKLVARKEQPGWGWWIEQGATTLWEDWKGESSLNHIMFGDVSNWMIQWIAGIGLDPQSPGFKHILFRPQPVGDLTWAKASHDSPYGQITSEWRIKGGKFSLSVTAPANTTATVIIPASIGKAKLVGSALSENDKFEIGSGTYEFVTSAHLRR